MYHKTGGYSLVDAPNDCPYCHAKINPIFKSEQHSREGLYTKEVFLICPVTRCGKGFVAFYAADDGRGAYWYKYVNKPNPVEHECSDIINEISENFCTIFNQSYHAEQLGLLEISGVGYRKAFEFLIKDFLTTKNPTKEDLIKKMQIGQCIADYVDDTKLKACAKRAFWLGNDHTHYIKRWEDRDLQDLKTLIKLSINWIESEILTENFEKSMPEGKNKKA